MGFNFAPTLPYQDQQKLPVVEELRSFVLKSVADELQKPAEDKESSGNPERMIGDRR